MLQYVAVCCSVLQCAAVCCSVLQCAAVYCGVLQRNAVLQCVWCKFDLHGLALSHACVIASISSLSASCVLQRVAACCSVLQRVAVCLMHI